MKIDAQNFVDAVREGMLESFNVLERDLSHLSERDISVKCDGTLVTSLDKRIESIFCELCSKRFPSIPVLGEEASATMGIVEQEGWIDSFFQSDFQIVIDPIDGTRNLIAGKPQYCIAAALTRRVGSGIWPMVGIVAVPREGTIYWSTPSGVLVEDCKTRAKYSMPRQSVCSSHISINSADRKWMESEGMNLKLPWVSSGSSVYDFLGTVTGRLRASLIGSQRLWDVMAPLSLGTAAGLELYALDTNTRVDRIERVDICAEGKEPSWGLRRHFVMIPPNSKVSDIVA